MYEHLKVFEPIFEGLSLCDVSTRNLRELLIGGFDTRELALLFMVRESEIWNRFKKTDGERNGSIRHSQSTESRSGIIGPETPPWWAKRGARMGLQGDK